MDDSRLMLTDEAWGRLSAVIAGVRSRAGAPPRLSDRDFVEAVLYPGRTGCPRRDLPERFGARDAVYRRSRRREAAGIWRPVRAAAGGPRRGRGPAAGQLGRPRPPARRRGAGGEGGQQAQALGRSRGGFGTKVHLAAADESTPVAVVLTPGQASDARTYPELIDAVPEGCEATAAVADKSCDSDAIRADLERRGLEAVIPPPACRREPIAYDEARYRKRDGVERLFSKLQQFRRVATRHDKLDLSFLAFIHLASALIMTR